MGCGGESVGLLRVCVRGADRLECARGPVRHARSPGATTHPLACPRPSLSLSLCLPLVCLSVSISLIPPAVCLAASQRLNSVWGADEISIGGPAMHPGEPERENEAKTVPFEAPAPSAAGKWSGEDDATSWRSGVWGFQMCGPALPCRSFLGGGAAAFMSNSDVSLMSDLWAVGFIVI